MTTADTDPSTAVRNSVRLAAAIEQAFDVFTAGIDRWWFRSHHLPDNEAGSRVTVTFTPAAGCTLV